MEESENNGIFVDCSIHRDWLRENSNLWIDSNVIKDSYPQILSNISVHLCFPKHVLQCFLYFPVFRKRALNVDSTSKLFKKVFGKKMYTVVVTVHEAEGIKLQSDGFVFVLMEVSREIVKCLLN